MKLTIEFDGEWWRVAWWWHDLQCRMTGHPGWKPPVSGSPLFNFFYGSYDKRTRCTRCGTPNPHEAQPQPLVHTFAGLGDW